MVPLARNTIVSSLLLAGAVGCAWAPKSAPPPQAALTQEEAEWWAANQHKKQFIKGKGYYVPGVNGFFDYDGHKIASDLGPGGAAEERGIFDRLSPKETMKSLKAAIGQGPSEKIARAALDEGDSLFRQKEYSKAAAKYRVAYKRWPDSPLEEEALFKAGESEFFADHYSNAEDEYALLIKKFPSTQYLSQTVIRRFAIGRYWEQCDEQHHHYPLTPNFIDKTRPRFDTAGHALREYDQIRLSDPTGSLSDDAVMAAANAYFRKGRWDDADYHYGLLRSEYPKSEHQFNAHLLGLRCKLLRYQGAGYELAPLDEAEELATQLLTQFPGELNKERDRVVQVRASIRSQRALRDWDMAEYYARGEYYGAAKIYYNKVVEDFPETQLAKQSHEKLDQYKAEPDNPTKTFQWLVDLFPESTREGPPLPKILPTSAKSSVSTTAAAPPSTTTR